MDYTTMNVTHEITRMRSLGELLASTNRGLSSFYLKEGDTPVRLIKAKDISDDGRLIAKSVDKELVKKTDLLKNVIVKPDDVIISLKGSSFKAALIGKGARDFVISANLIAMTCNQNFIKPDYLAALMNSSWGQAELKKQAGGSVIMSLTMDAIKGMMVPVPSIDRQKQVVETIKALQEYLDLIKREEQLMNKISDNIFALSGGSGNEKDETQTIDKDNDSPFSYVEDGPIIEDTDDKEDSNNVPSWLYVEEDYVEDD